MVCWCLLHLQLSMVGRVVGLEVRAVLVVVALEK
jgi:hypothetical protein